jgi:hypothetical protein
LNRLKHFVAWLDVPLEKVTPVKVLAYIDHLLDKRLKPSTINYHLLMSVLQCAISPITPFIAWVFR